MTAKMIPATIADRPVQRMRLDAVIFILLSFPSFAIFGSPLSTLAAIPTVLVFSLVVIFRSPPSTHCSSSDTFAYGGLTRMQREAVKGFGTRTCACTLRLYARRERSFLAKLPLKRSSEE